MVLVCELILVLVAGILSFSQLDCSLQEPEETLYAEIPREMLVQDQLLVPVRHGQVFYDKPPLFYWLVMGMYRLCGVHDWAARLVSSGAAFLCVLVTYAWGKKTVGPQAAFAGALVLCLSPRWAQLARMVSTNSLLALWVVASLGAAHLALRDRREARRWKIEDGRSRLAKWRLVSSILNLRFSILDLRWWFLSALCCGLGILTKGPVALVLVAVPTLLYQWLNRHTVHIIWRLWAIYLTVAGLVALPWFVILAIRDPSFVYYFVWVHHVRRVLDPIDHPQPFWYYGPLLFVGMMPWTLLLLGFIKQLVDKSIRISSFGQSGFFLLAGVWSLLFFSAAVCKRPCYILPIMPPLALALGCYMDVACGLSRIRKTLWACAAAVTFLLLLGADHYWLPRYADKYSVRGRILPFVETCSNDTPVMCYPHIWDGVSFYLQRNDVQVYRSTQLEEMMSALQREQQSLVVIKEDANLDRFLESLPKSLEFIPCTRQHPIAVGWVRHRSE
jgi:dolichol-phosphate mannosyltransferase